MKKYYIGTSGWNFPHWKGKFYPEKLSRNNWFNYFSKNFRTVEINNTFYKWPEEKNIIAWYKQAPPGFNYTIKAPRYITHLKQLKETEELVKKFYNTLSPLKEKTGAILFQLPPRFKRNRKNLKKLKAFLASLDAEKDNVVEFRDRAWWEDDVYELFRKHDVSFCAVSGLGMPEEAPLTSKASYFRFHGEDYTGSYAEEILESYAEKIKNIKAERVYAYFNNDENAYSARNALRLLSYLKKSG